MCNLYFYIFGMKNFVKIMILLFSCFAAFSFSFAQQWRWSDRWSTPFQVFENVVAWANTWDKIQETYLDTINSDNWSEAPEFKITNTLNSVRQHIGPYIQWAVYIGFVMSVAWLIICGFIMSTWWISKSSWFEKVKSKIINACLAVLLLSWFYIIIKLIVGVINMLVWE